MLTAFLLGFKAFARGLFSILAKVPWKVWAVLGIVLAIWYIDHKRNAASDARGYARATVEWQAKETERLRLQKIADDKAQAELNALQARMVAQQLDHENELQEAETLRLAGLAALKGRFAAYVSPLQLSRCPDVPRGFLRYWADTASFANGGNPPAAPASQATLDPPSGVPLPAVSDTLAEQAGAYRACADRQAGWLKYQKDVEDWAGEVQGILKGEKP